MKHYSLQNSYCHFASRLYTLSVGTFFHNAVPDTRRQIRWLHQTQQWPNDLTLNLNPVHTRENQRKPEFPHQQFHLTPNWDGPKQLIIEGMEEQRSSL